MFKRNLKNNFTWRSGQRINGKSRREKWNSESKDGEIWYEVKNLQHENWWQSFSETTKKKKIDAPYDDEVDEIINIDGNHDYC